MYYSKNGLEFNPSPVPSQTELIAPSFRITVQACTHLYYRTDRTVLYSHLFTCFSLLLNKGSFKKGTCAYLCCPSLTPSTVLKHYLLNEQVNSELFGFFHTINIQSYELPKYSVPTVGNFLIGSTLISISLVNHGYES